MARGIGLLTGTFGSELLIVGSLDRANESLTAPLGYTPPTITHTPPAVRRITEIYRSDPPRRRECLYYLSLGHFKMGNFDEARRFNGKFLRPKHSHDHNELLRS